MIILVILVVLFAFFLALGLIDGNRFEVVKETFELQDLKKDCRFVLISDVHNKVYGEKNAPLIKAVKQMNPDFIIVAGDLITANPSEDMTPGIELVKALSRDFTIYYGLGNHEMKIKERHDKFGEQFTLLKKSLMDSNIVWLENESAEIPVFNIRITGLALTLEYFAHFQLRKMEKGTLENMLGKPDKTKCNLLIAHNPDYFSEYVKWGADLTLSGHVHGGIMRLPWLGGVLAPSYRLFPKYDGGVFQENGAFMLLGRGVGAHTIPLRFFNPAQLYEVTLKPCRGENHCSSRT